MDMELLQGSPKVSWLGQPSWMGQLAGTAWLAPAKIFLKKKKSRNLRKIFILLAIYSILALLTTKNQRKPMDFQC